MSAKPETQNTMTLYARAFPVELHVKIKSRAALERITLQQWLVEAAREKLERGEKVTP